MATSRPNMEDRCFDLKPMPKSSLRPFEKRRSSSTSRRQVKPLPPRPCLPSFPRPRQPFIHPIKHAPARRVGDDISWRWRATWWCNSSLEPRGASSALRDGSIRTQISRARQNATSTHQGAMIARYRAHPSRGSTSASNSRQRGPYAPRRDKTEIDSPASPRTR